MKVNAILVAHLSLFFICVPVLMQKAGAHVRQRGMGCRPVPRPLGSGWFVGSSLPAGGQQCSAVFQEKAAVMERRASGSSPQMKNRNGYARTASQPNRANEPGKQSGQAERNRRRLFAGGRGT